MKVHVVDLLIIVLYLVFTVTIGVWISKKGSKNLDTYFLGGKQLPWYLLGVSNASGMFDITGTMWLVYLCFVYGLKGVWMPWLWPVFNQIFLMIYLSAWIRRSNVLTGAEWMSTRFGGKGGHFAHITIVIFALISVIGFIAYGFAGIGKFAAIFLPWDLSPNTYATIFMALTTIYVVKGGMISVVFTELLQFFIMTLSSIAIGIIAMVKVSPEMLSKVIPAGWKNIFFGWRLDLDWTGILDSVNTKIAEDGYSLFTIFFMVILFKGILISLAGSAPNYDMQRILATKNPKEAAKMSGLVSLVLFFPRYMMVAGLTVLALVYYSPTLKGMGANIDFEMVLPYTLQNLIPVGLLGIVIAGLISAFMSTFAATVNATPAYVINDIYKRYINPNAGDKKFIFLSYICSLLFVVIGIIFGIYAKSINAVTLWIVSALWGGFAASNILKWYWWRLNGHGYSWGMIGGIIAALILPKAFPELSSLQSFPFIFGISVIGCILGSFLTKPEDEKLLKKFYMTVRPWGFWKPVRDKVMKEHPDFKPNKNFKRDVFNIVVGIIWQTTLVALPVYIVIKEKVPVFTGILILIITSFILKKNWLDKLEN